MQVMNGGEFDDKDILVGQAGKTEGFGVTDDPMLMSMLSTGLYANPLRTMLQEIMFNAWDAHRMGNCQDKPIDVYLNETTGLIVRDYGPGIAPKDMRPIYCIYGNSTKRKDDNQTGGFGLGSKSPYAYNDSFTVTSHHDQKKSMYLMKRVSEENNGGPGMTPIIQEVDTSEKGLMVTVPLKTERDIKRSYEYIKDIAYLSGIKMNLHLEGEETETIESDSVPAGEWLIDDEKTGGLFAIYGGVRYKIEEDDHYSAEYQFMKKISNLLGTLYIGFRPNSLTPLPNREGLNLSENTVENIKAQFEIMEEFFQNMLIPTTRTMMKHTFQSLCASDIQPQFLAMRWNKLGDRSMREISDSSHPILAAAKEDCPEDLPQSMWNSLCDACYQATSKIERMIGQEKWNQMKYIFWAKKFPHLKCYKDFLMYSGSGNRNYQSVEMIEVPRGISYVIEAQKIAETAAGHEATIRIPKSGGEWNPATNIRRAGKVKDVNSRQMEIIKALGKDRKIPDQRYPDRLWFTKDGKEFSKMLLHKVIIIGKTLGALKETSWNWQAMFSPQYGTVSSHHAFHRSNFGQHYYSEHDRCVVALVVHQKKGGYDRAVQALKDAGYDVLEADAPVPKTRPKAPDGTEIPVQHRGPITYPLLDRGHTDWCSYEEVEKPTCYLKTTQTELNGYYTVSGSIVEYVKTKTKRLVCVLSASRVPRLERLKVPEFSEKVHQLVVKILEDEDRLRLMKLHHFAYQESNIPSQILRLPEFSKFMGLPYLRTSQIESFKKDYKFLMDVKTYHRNGNIKHDTKMLIRTTIDDVDSDPAFSLVRKRCESLEMFDKGGILNHINGMKRGELKVFSEKLMRFMRTV